MNSSIAYSLLDPRLRFDFDPALLPACDGALPPEPHEWESNPRARMKFEFAAAYYEINSSYRQLLAARKTPSPFEQRERAALQAIECAILRRDALEDKYAPTGVLATPVLMNGVVTDIQFLTPRPSREQPSMISMCFAVTPPVGQDHDPAILDEK
jgi:hypothetical protein